MSHEVNDQWLEDKRMDREEFCYAFGKTTHDLKVDDNGKEYIQVPKIMDDPEIKDRVYLPTNLQKDAPLE